jgi:hypothetical protein|uniref:Uncharacterized protein n=1 Tax=viral metagenome TaxID=1070528 RepID=A0A6C0E8H4_9ZZZZ
MFFNNTIFKRRFQFQLSYFLIPLACVIYIYIPNTRKYLLYHIVCIGIIGTIDTYYNYIENNIGIGTAVISTLVHLSLLIVLINFKKYGGISIISLFLLCIANLTILLLPYWPYPIKRETLLILYNLIYISLYFAFTLLL